MLKSLVALVAVMAAVCLGQTTSAFAIGDAQGGASRGTGSLAHMRMAGDTRVPRDYVATPNGYMHKDCVVEVKRGERVVVPSNRDCAHPRLDPHGAALPSRRTVAAEGATDGQPKQLGWVEAVLDVNSGPTTYLGARWQVPQDPRVDDDQVVFLFPGLESKHLKPGSTPEKPLSAGIMQPVLGWNQLGVHGWSIASWYCCGQNGDDPEANHTAAIPVQAGDWIQGIVKGEDCNVTGICKRWRIDMLDETRRIQDGFDLVAPGVPMDYTFGGALEAYYVDRCDQFPATPTTFALKLKDALGRPKASKWEANVTPHRFMCNYSATYDADSATLSY